MCFTHNHSKWSTIRAFTTLAVSTEGVGTNATCIIPYMCFTFNGMIHGINVHVTLRLYNAQCNVSKYMYAHQFDYISGEFLICFWEKSHMKGDNSIPGTRSCWASETLHAHVWHTTHSSDIHEAVRQCSASTL